MLTNIEARYRAGFYNVRTMRMHVAMLWETRTLRTNKFGHGPDDARARTLSVFVNRYWPAKDVVTAWVREHWDEWQDPSTRPTWFTPKWRAHFPSGWLPALQPP